MCVCVWNCVCDGYAFVNVASPNYFPSNAFVLKMFRLNDLKCTSITLSSVIYKAGCKMCEWASWVVYKTETKKIVLW